jgi:hypothetical protein
VTREKWLDPSNWASLKPFGMGEEHPNNYLELWSAFKENRDQAATPGASSPRASNRTFRCGFSAESCPPRSTHTSPLASLAISRHPRSRRTRLAGRPLDLDRSTREGPRGRRGKTRSAPSTLTWLTTSLARSTRTFSPKTTAADVSMPSGCASRRGQLATTSLQRLRSPHRSSGLVAAG